MSDRQTPISTMDRARASILKFRAEGIGMPRPARLVMPEIDLRVIADELRPDSMIDLERRARLTDVMTAAEYRDHVVKSARKGELYLWGVQVVIDDTTNEICCYGSAARGATEYRDDQPAGVDNSQQAAQGCRVAAGGSDGLTDTCLLGTADHPIRSGHGAVVNMLEAWREMHRAEPSMVDLPLPRALFDQLMALEGVNRETLPSADGRRYWEWQGGGIRYWRGHKEMPRG